VKIVLFPHFHCRCRCRNRYRRRSRLSRSMALPATFSPSTPPPMTNSWIEGSITITTTTTTATTKSDWLLNPGCESRIAITTTIASASQARNRRSLLPQARNASKIVAGGEHREPPGWRPHYGWEARRAGPKKRLKCHPPDLLDGVQFSRPNQPTRILPTSRLSVHAQWKIDYDHDNDHDSDNHVELDLDPGCASRITITTTIASASQSRDRRFLLPQARRADPSASRRRTE